MNTELHSASTSGPSEHLTEAQFAELLAGPAPAAGSDITPAHAHLLACEQCSTEMDSLRESLALFRDATMAYAGEQLRRMPPVPIPARTRVSPALWPVYLAAAAALVLAAFVPMQMLHQRSQKAAQQAATTHAATNFERYATESDEALLEDVDRATSASVPKSMQALADPTAAGDLSVQKSVQGKD
jgi:hypothetical protein